MADDLQPDEATLVDGRLTRVDLAAARAPALYARLRAEPDLETIYLRTDFGGNEDALAALAAEIRQHGLPPALRRLAVDRWRQWNTPGDDELVLSTTPDGAVDLCLQLDDPTTARVALDAFAALLARAAPSSLTLQLRARGRTDIDPVLAVPIASPPPLRALTIEVGGRSERDWVQWVAALRLSELLARCPLLTELTLPMAELTLDPLDLPALRTLRLHWLGGTPLGPSDGREWGPGPVPRASGLEFLRHARLPALTELGVDFQYTWYVGWLPADIAALCAADLPALTRVVLRYCPLDDELCARLPTAPWARRLEVLDLTGTDLGDAAIAALLSARARFPALRTTLCFRPHDVPDPLWRAFTDAYHVESPP